MSQVPLHLGCSVGGSTVRIARVMPSGNFGDVRVARRGEPGDPFSTAAGLANYIAGVAAVIAQGQFVDLFGLATKGPITLDNGKLVVLKWSDPPFCDRRQPFQQLIEDALRQHGVRYGRFDAMIDSEAALRGERHPRGSLSRAPSGMIRIFGSGRGVLACENGNIVPEIRSDQPGSDRWRVYSSDGRHLICIPEGHDAFRYEYRGIPQGQTRAPKEAHETFYSERTSGLWLPKIVAADLRALGESDRNRVLRSMNAGDLDSDAYLSSTSRGASAVDAEKRILTGLTVAALAADPWALTRIHSIGVEEGLALAAFVWEFQEYQFVENVVQVSSIGESLGKGVQDGNGEDLLITSMQSSLLTELTRRGIGNEKARRIASGVRRSALDWKRELLPFDPEQNARR